MSDNDKKIKSLIAGLLSNNDSKVESITRELVESIMLTRQDLIADTLRKSFQRETDV